MKQHGTRNMEQFSNPSNPKPFKPFKLLENSNIVAEATKLYNECKAVITENSIARAQFEEVRMCLSSNDDSGAIKALELLGREQQWLMKRDHMPVIATLHDFIFIEEKQREQRRQDELNRKKIKRKEKLEFIFDNILKFGIVLFIAFLLVVIAWKLK